MTDQKKLAIVCNPLAGSGRAVILSEEIIDELSKREIANTLFKGKWPENFDGFTDVIIVGGDGTLNYFINKYPEIKLPLVIFNGGTGNDVHSVLYGNKSFSEKLNIALTASPKPIDAGRCNNKYFINGVGIGFEGAVAKGLLGKNKRPGKATFMWAILKKIFFYKSEIYKGLADEYNGEGKHLMISIMNGHCAGGGFYVAPNSAIDDGLLDVVIVNKLHPILRLRWLPVIEKGKHMHLPFIKYFRTKKIVITSPQSIQSHLDGEYYEANRLEIEMLPGKYLFRY